MKVGEGGKTFGAISTKEIAAAAKEQLNLELDKKKISVDEPIRSLGVHNVKIKLAPEGDGDTQSKSIRDVKHPGFTRGVRECAAGEPDR